jgi:predicted dehydrogenase
MSTSSRRSFLKSATTSAAAAATISAISARAYAQNEDSATWIALVGCGGRGGGAADNALSVVSGETKLVAMADVFESHVEGKYKELSGKYEASGKVQVPPERRFIGFDAYKSAMDCLRPGDVAILATPAAFRWPMYQYAIEKGLNVFMEKPVTIDAPTSVRMLEINKAAIAKNLKVGVGLMCRHCDARRELFDRIQNGEIGDLNLIRVYRMAGPTASAASGKNDTDMNDLMYQITRFHSFLWLSGGAVSDFLIHNIDEGCWMKNDFPVKVQATGGRHYRGDMIDQNFDHYSMEYTFKDGAKMTCDGRTMPGCYQEFASYVHGSKGMAVVSTAGHSPAKPRIYSGQSEDESKLVWAYPQPEANPYQLEWNHLIDAIRNDIPYNEVERGVMSSAVTSMGRMAAHTGQEITLEDFLKVDHEFAPNVESLTLDGPSPLPPKEDGTYPIPMPGLIKNREYA